MLHATIILIQTYLETFKICIYSIWWSNYTYHKWDNHSISWHHRLGDMDFILNHSNFTCPQLLPHSVFIIGTRSTYERTYIERNTYTHYMKKDLAGHTRNARNYFMHCQLDTVIRGLGHLWIMYVGRSFENS